MNLDIGELEYNPSARDLSAARVHHLLSEDLWKTSKKVIQLTKLFFKFNF